MSNLESSFGRLYTSWKKVSWFTSDHFENIVLVRSKSENNVCDKLLPGSVCMYSPFKVRIFFDVKSILSMLFFKKIEFIILQSVNIVIDKVSPLIFIDEKSLPSNTEWRIYEPLKLEFSKYDVVKLRFFSSEWDMSALVKSEFFKIALFICTPRRFELWKLAFVRSESKKLEVLRYIPEKSVLLRFDSTKYVLENTLFLITVFWKSVL